ncbi:MAG: ORF6N domain-containing protein [Candidatus Margulisiibacteriota bacterium]|jgi:hypothetical protein
MAGHIVISREIIERKIYLLRGVKVMLDRDLATLYGIKTGNLNKAVKRNNKRFPEDFMFQLNRKEAENLRFQFGIANIFSKSRSLPYAFTEQGIAMLSSILHSEQAIAINIRIMRVFIQIKKLWLSNEELRVKIEEIEKKYGSQDEKINAILYLLSGSEDDKEWSSGFDPVGFLRNR